MSTWIDGAPSGTAGPPPEPVGVHECTTVVTLTVRVTVRHDCDVARIDKFEQSLSENLTSAVSEALVHRNIDIDSTEETTIED